jgi:sigma-E factor negative regulatory protein RseC
MSLAARTLPDLDDRTTVEGIALVVAADRSVAWLEPEQTTSCGACHSVSVCGVKSGHSRLVARRFKIANDHDLKVGDRVVVGVSDNVLLKGSLAAYAMPLVTLVAGGLYGQSVFGGDGGAAIGALTGLALGLVAARFYAVRLSGRGDLAPRFIRHAEGLGPDADCQVQ